MPQQKYLLIAILFCLMILLTNCGETYDSDVVLTSPGEATVDWVTINPPPGIEGPCYAFFDQHGHGDGGVGWSGVWCR